MVGTGVSQQHVGILKPPHAHPCSCLDARGGSPPRYPGGSSDLAAGAAGAATSTPSLLRRLPERGVRLTPGLVPVGDLDRTAHARRACATGTYRVT